jgi:hypothetical protein
MSSLNVIARRTSRYLTLERCMHDFQLDSPTEMSWLFASDCRALDVMPRHFSWTVQLKYLGILLSTTAQFT